MSSNRKKLPPKLPPISQRKYPITRKARSVVYYTVTPPAKNGEEPEIIMAVFNCPWCSYPSGVPSYLTGNMPPINCPRCSGPIRIPVDKAALNEEERRAGTQFIAVLPDGQTWMQAEGTEIQEVVTQDEDVDDADEFEKVLNRWVVKIGPAGEPYFEKRDDS